MTQPRPLFGVETEYAVTAMKGKLSLEREGILASMMEAARARLVHLPDLSSAGVFLENGSRLYIDCGQHPELSTPECTDPWSVVRYIQAGNKIIADLAHAAESGHPNGTKVMCFRNNVDYGGSRTTWGSHESYLHRVSPSSLQPQIIPHLVSRIIYTGAGGFNPLSSGLEFTLSPRVAHISRVISGDSTSNRGIFHTKNEPLSREEFNRLHIICGETLCSETAMFLRVGTTALIVAMVEGGLKPGGEMQLESPLDALRLFASDPTCQKTVRLKNWRRLTAIEIQRHYLSVAETHARESYMPEWTGEVCRVWHDVLDRLENDPRSTDQMLDWSMKLSLYIDQSAKLGIRWERLTFWNEIVNRIDAALREANLDESQMTLDHVIGAQSPIPEEAGRLTKFLQSKGLDWRELSELLEIRQRFMEIDTRFGQLGERGIFQSLDSAGALTHRIDGVGDPQHAVTEPPANGRARTRGQVIRRLAGSAQSQCDWQRIVNFENGQALDLSDPFASEELWRPLRFDDSPRSSRIADLLGAVHDTSITEEDDRYARRREASDLVLCGDYLGAEVLLRGLQLERYEVPSTHCHLARVLLMTGREPEAREQINRAWASRDQAAAYVVLRILFFQCIFAVFDGSEIAGLVGQIKGGLRGSGVHMDWTIMPLLDQVRPRLGATYFPFLKALAEALCAASAMPRLQEFPQWRDVEAVA